MGFTAGLMHTPLSGNSQFALSQGAHTGPMTDDDARLTAGALSRRRLLQFGLAAVPFSAVVLAACQPTKKAAPGCVLSPQMTEGPFYLNLGRVRSNITEGRPGLPLLLAFTVVNVNANCAPIANAAVDIWHTDAL